jgi:endonuclease/exonuclease/phosphatase family metal-dependent hydrolase
MIRIRFSQCLALLFLLTFAAPRGMADEVIRIMAGNITTGSSDYDNGEGNRIFQGLDPDIALVQELNYLGNSTTDIRSWVDMNFGTNFSIFRESGNGIPNAIVSRYPIIASGEWEDEDTLSDRDFVYAKIDIPGDKDLWAISVHLKASSGSTNVTRRNNQAKQLLRLIAANIPASDYLVIGGDFNTYSRTEACISTLSIENDNPDLPEKPGVFITTSPWPADQAGNGNTNKSREEPYDWVIPDADLNARSTALVIGARTFPNGLVYDSRVSSPYAFLPAPIQSSDSADTNMQHMAVMRAFLIPTNAAPSITAAANSSSVETVTDPDSSVYEIVRGTSVGLSVAATDDAGQAALTYTWSKTAGASAAVGFSANGTNAAKNTTATFQATGNYTLTATVRDAPGLTVTSSVRVRVVQAAAGLVVTPGSATLVVNATQAFTAALADQFGQPMAGSFTWSATGGGSVGATGVFTATTAGGPFSVTASAAGFSDSSGITVTPAMASVSLADLNPTYDGDPKSVTVSTTPPGRAHSILYAGSSSPPTDAGSYPVTVTITDPNYQGSASGNLVIEKAVAGIAFGGLAATYDGNTKPVTATTTPSGLPVAILYDGVAEPPILAGSYTVTASVSEVNYQGAATDTLVIAADPWALWKNTHFTGPEREQGLAADLVDADEDGFLNLAEYALGTHPREFTPPLPVVLDEAGLSITFGHPVGLPGISYAADASSDLDAWSPVPLTETAPGTLRATDPPPVDPTQPRFLRLRFERE